MLEGSNSPNQTIKYRVNISTFLHRNDSKLVLLINPNQKTIVI